MGMSGDSALDWSPASVLPNPTPTPMLRLIPMLRPTLSPMPRPTVDPDTLLVGE